MQLTTHDGVTAVCSDAPLI